MTGGRYIQDNFTNRLHFSVDISIHTFVVGETGGLISLATYLTTNPYFSLKQHVYRLIILKTLMLSSKPIHKTDSESDNNERKTPVRLILTSNYS